MNKINTQQRIFPTKNKKSGLNLMWLLIPISVASIAIIVFINFSFKSNIKDGVKDQNDIYKEITDFVVKTIGVTATITSAIYVAEQIKYNVNEKIKDRALTYISRWNEGSIAVSIEKVSPKIRKIVEQAEDKQKELDVNIVNIINNKFEKDIEFRENSIRILNFLEEVATAHYYNLVNHVILQDFYKALFNNYYARFNPWIEIRRKQAKNPKFCKNFTDLCEKWNNEDMRWNMTVLRESPWYQEILEKGIQEGILPGIALGLELKFGAEGLELMPEIRNITDVEKLKAIQVGLKTAQTLAELRQIYT